jgi:hypothetical protein
MGKQGDQKRSRDRSKSGNQDEDDRKIREMRKYSNLERQMHKY